MEDTIKFGPCPEKLWVGMKGKTPVWGVVTLIKNGEYFLTWDSEGFVFTTSVEDGMSVDSKKCNSIVEWEQPVVTCCDSEPEPDWKAKYEQLLEHYAHLEAELKAQECAYNVVVERKNLLQRERDRLFRERNAALAERDNMRRKADKLDRIEEVLRGECEDDD